MVEPKVRGWLKLLGLAALLAAAGGLWAIYAGRGFHSAPTERTEKDFRDNAERLRFARSFLPFEVPDETQVEKLRYVSWLDVTCDCTLRLSPEGLQQVKSAIDDEWREEDGRFKLERGAYSCEITFLPDEASISVKTNYGSGQQPPK